MLKAAKIIMSDYYYLFWNSYSIHLLTFTKETFLVIEYWKVKKHY